jgi:hypothetical protein
MLSLPISAIPNQSFSARLEDSIYDFTIKALNGAASISIARDNVTIIEATRLTPGTPVLPYSYLATGNFVFTTLGDELPDYTKFGVSQELVYLTAAEVEAIRG